MKRLVLPVMNVAGLALFFSILAEHAFAAEAAKTPPKDRVVAMYFHRTHAAPPA